MNQAEQLIAFLKQHNWRIRCVESCTAGALTAAIGAVAGASEVLDRSWVTYSNQAKHEEVDVPLHILKTCGAVSKEVAIAMVEGAVVGCADNTLALATTGIAGPSGGTQGKPVGTVWVAMKKPHHPAIAQCFHFDGSRAEVQKQTVTQALAMPLSA